MNLCPQTQCYSKRPLYLYPERLPTSSSHEHQQLLFVGLAHTSSSREAFYRLSGSLDDTENQQHYHYTPTPQRAMPSYTTLTTLALALSATAFPMSNYSLASVSARTSCSAGSIVCNGPSHFALCNPNGPLIFQSVAAGMICDQNQMVASTAASNASQTSTTAYGTTAPPATPAPVSTTIIITSYATVTISSSTSTSSSAASTASTTPTATSSAAPLSSSPSETSALAPSSTGHAVTYQGDGSAAAGWPRKQDWIGSFEKMFSMNEPALRISCSQFGQPNNSPTEIADLKSAIQKVSESTGVDSRFILAIVMQESVGCVRVWSTSYSVVNPGLMQSHDGISCNTARAAGGAIVENGTASVPCSSNAITQMISDVVKGTASGPGLSQLLHKAGGTDAQAYYKAARYYNSGSIPADGNLAGAGATASYASDIANKLANGFVPTREIEDEKACSVLYYNLENSWRWEGVQVDTLEASV